MSVMIAPTLIVSLAAIPHSLKVGIGAVAICVEDMSTVFVYLNAFYILCIDVSANMIALIYNQNFFACVMCHSGKHCPEKPRADY